MSAKPVILRCRAEIDIDEALEYYFSETGEKGAMDFADNLQRGFRHIARHPASGSSRYAHELDLPGLRAWPVKRFPYLVFYVERDDRIDVWRVLHAARDIPAWMAEPE